MVRVATPEDAVRIAEIYRPYVTDTVISFEEEPPDSEEMGRRIAATLERFPFLVYELDQIVGYAYAGTHRARASYRWSADVTIYLDAQVHGQGIGKLLYTALFEVLRRQGFRNLCAGITLPNDASVGLHRALGFRDVGTYPNIGYKFGRWHDTHWMRLELLPPTQNPSEPILFPELAE